MILGIQCTEQGRHNADKGVNPKQEDPFRFFGGQLPILAVHVALVQRGNFEVETDKSYVRARFFYCV